MRPASIASFFFGCLFTLVALVGFGYLYLHYGHPPVAVADPSFPFEAKIVHVPLHARIEREITQPPFTPTEANLVEGAHVYIAQCASCHGTPTAASSYGKWMFPRTPSLWKSHRPGVVGVSDDEPGESYWKVKNGIRLSGMPSFEHVLSNDQMWDVTWLVKNANQPLSPAVAAILAQPQPR